MKRIIFLMIALLLFLGCDNKNVSPQTNIVQLNIQGTVIKMPYNKPIDFKQFEVYISETASFNPTGWDGTKWAGEPNATAEWNGADKNLFMITSTEPIQVTGLTAGKTYYVRVVAVDKANQRSIPSDEYTAVAGDAQRSSTIVVAASDASPKSKAGADFVCTGTSDQNVINRAIISLPRTVMGNGIVINAFDYYINADPSNFSTVDDYYAGMYIEITAGTGAGQIRSISKSFLVNTYVNFRIESYWDIVPDTTSRFAIYKVHGGSVMLTEGTFYVDDYIYLPSNVTISGSGTSTTICCNPPKHYSYSVFQNSNIYYEDTNINLIGFNVKSSYNTLSESTSSFVNFYNVTNCTLSGIISTAAYGSNGINLHGDNNIVTKCSFSGTAEFITSVNDFYWIAGLSMSGKNNKIIDNYFFNNGYGIYYLGANNNNNQISGNHIYNNASTGMYLSFADNNVITGNQVYDNNTLGLTEPKKSSNIYIEYMNYNSIQNNTCRKGSNANLPLYGIYIESGTGNLVTNNDCYQGGRTSGIFNAGTSTNFGSGNRNNNGTWSTTPN